MQLLLIEDNHDLAKNIRKYLELEGFTIARAADGTQGLQIAQAGIFDCILLDLMLPGIDGITLCQKLKKTKEVPVIMTTAKGQLDDKMEGFDVGADDYLVKPFEMQELVARIKAVVKRYGKIESFERNNIKVFVEKQEVYKDEERIELTLKEFQILAHLVQNYGIAVSRADIVEDVRGGEFLFESDAKLDVYISNLRKKLNKDMIQTVKGFGYKIEK